MSRPVFLYGTLRDEALRATVLGHHDVPVTPARLADHVVLRAEAAAYPLIVARDGSDAEGILVDLDDEAAARLDFYEGGFGYVTRRTEVTTGDARRIAEVYFPQGAAEDGAGPWSLEMWQTTTGALERHAAQEAMSYFGRISPGELARRFPMIRGRAQARLAARQVAPATLRTDRGPETVVTESFDRPHAGFFTLERHSLRHPTFDGGMSSALTREAFVGWDAVIVLPYDPVRDAVLLIEQFRMGPYARGDLRPWTLEPVAGRVDAGEGPVEAAHREAHEEAGLTLSRLEHVADYYASAGCSTEFFYTYVGLCDLTDADRRRGGVADEGEDILTHVVPLDAALALIDSGEANNGPLILALFWLDRHRDRLRSA